MLKRLNEVNKIDVNSVQSEKFRTYGRIIEGYKFDNLISYMIKDTVIPESGNIYIASESEMERDPIHDEIKNHFYGGMNIEIGYCNGRNSTLNGMEFHKSSEILVAVTDLMLILGHVWDIDNNQFDGENSEVFYVKKGSVIEIYSTTLHLSPCKTSDAGFKAIIILPEGTNTPLASKNKGIEDIDRLLLLRNKWIIAHEERKVLTDQGAYAGIIGANLELLY